MPKNPSTLAWIDVETSGVDVLSDRLLEVACIMTDMDLNVLSTESFHATILHSPGAVQVMRDAADSIVRKMHDDSGLWERLPTGTHVVDVDTDLRNFIAAAAPEPRTTMIAGNSTRLDLTFTERYLPKTAAHLHYRMFDLTPVANALNAWGGVKVMRKRKVHTALDDIKESIQEAHYLKDAIKKMRGEKASI